MLLLSGILGRNHFKGRTKKYGWNEDRITMVQRLSIEEVKALIQNEEEGTELEFKGSDKLRKDQAVAICKTVSAFANSNGGRLILGINANVTPKVFDQGINPDEWKEINGQEPELWLRQMFSTKIQRNIAPPDIYFLDHPELSGRKIIIIDVAKSTIGAHQLKEESDRFAYYYRNGSQNKQMEDWQIRDVMNRSSSPDLYIDFKLTCPDQNSRWNQHTELFQNHTFLISTGVRNQSITPAEYFSVTFYYDNRLEIFTPFQSQGGINLNQMQEIQYRGQRDFPLTLSDNNVNHYDVITLELKPHLPLFGTNEYHFIKFFSGTNNWPLTFKDENYHQNRQYDHYIKWEIQAPGMIPRYGIEKITYLFSSQNLTHKTIERGLVSNE